MFKATASLQIKSPQLIKFCERVFERHPRYKTYFYFADRQVQLVLDDFGESERFPYGEVHIARFEVRRKSRGKGLASIAMQALTYGADFHKVPITLTPAAYDDNGGLSQRQLELFYRRYGFKAEYGSCISCGSTTSMIRKPR